MFGAVPKTMWSRWIEPDERNRIPMATRSLIVEDDAGRKLIVDLGNGDKSTEKLREIFAIPDGPHVPVSGVTDVLLTHLHFDHAGGISSWNEDGSIRPNYPDARHYVSRANYKNAVHPNIRERSSYLEENWRTLDLVETIFTEDGQEIWPGLTVHQAHGHTRGLQWVLVSDGSASVAFPSDLCPTSHHLPAHYTMGYDMCTETAMFEKSNFIQSSNSMNRMIIFQHDPCVELSRVVVDHRGRPVLDEAQID